MLSTLTTSLGSLALLAALLPAANGQTLTAETIQVLGNNSLFTRWRPTSHFIAPAGWLNVCCFSASSGILGSELHTYSAIRTHAVPCTIRRAIRIIYSISGILITLTGVRFALTPQSLAVRCTDPLSRQHLLGSCYVEGPNYVVRRRP